MLPIFKIDNIVNDDPIKTEHSYSDNRISDADASEANTKKSQMISGKYFLFLARATSLYQSLSKRMIITY